MFKNSSREIKEIIKELVLQEMKNTLDGINSRLGITEKRITELGDIAIETIQTKMLREKEEFYKMKHQCI